MSSSPQCPADARSSSGPTASWHCASALLYFSIAVGLGCSPLRAAEPPSPPLGWDALHRLDLLPAYKTSIQIGMASSYDRSGGNDDGFSGKYSVLRKEPVGLVIADLQGPGVIHRIWTPTPSDDPMDFYFDGEEKPRFSVAFRQLFLGNHPPFVKPLVGYGVGGFFSYVPIPFAESCKIVIRGERVQFHQVNYSTYPTGTPIRTFQPALASQDQPHFDKAVELFAATGRDISPWGAPPGARIETRRRTLTLAPRNSVVLYESTEPGRIVGLRLSPASALIDKQRSLVLRMSFDGDAPAVLCPAGDFFGFAWGEPAMRSLLVGADAQSAYCYFPMPFDRSARVELLSEATSGSPIELTAEVIHSPTGRQPNEGRFHALWHRENPTAIGQPFTFLDTQARGHVVGAVLQSQGLESGKTLFFEGDDQTWIDGNLAIHGTGSEDFFNGGWYDVPDRWEKRLSFPWSGCLGYQKHLGRTGGYRLLLADAYPFRQSLRQIIEHSGTDNNIPTDYCAVTYLYADHLPNNTVTLPPLAARAVVDPSEVVFPAWWQIPIRAWTFQNASLSRGQIKLGDEEIRFLSTRADGQDWFGPPFLYLTLDLPADGQYQIQIVAVKGPAQGKIQLFADEIPVADPVDLYRPQLEKSGRLTLGTLPFRQGQNELMLKIVGKHEAATALGLDLVEIVCLRQSPP
ncbi:MAG: DUF2961 domain-containing protein [Verrucomicrobia bacterium]|nr:DUF2961 domain-containing protein [Verrucomicrobiota bacterium]